MPWVSRPRLWSSTYFIIMYLRGCRGRVVMRSGWESESPGFEPTLVQATFDPRLPKKIQQEYSQSYSVPLIIYFAKRTLKKRDLVCEIFLTLEFLLF